MKNKDQILLEQAYQKILENLEIRDQYGDVMGRQSTNADLRNYETNKQLEDDAKRKNENLASKWLLKGFSSIDSLKKDINDNLSKVGFFDPQNLKVGDKKSQDFIMGLAKQQLSNNLDILKQVNPDAIIKRYRSEVDSEIEKKDNQREEQYQTKVTQERGSFDKKAYDETIQKLEQIGFKPAGSVKKDETGIRVKPMSKTIGGVMSGRKKETITVNVNPNGSINKDGTDYDTWYRSRGKGYATAKKGWF